MRDLILLVYQAVVWFLSLGNKFFRVAPVLTGATVAFTIASQLLLLVGFLLPLKVVLLLGSETIPYYFPAFMAEFGRERLIVLLSVASVLFYFSHLLCDTLVARFSEQGAELLAQRSRKITIFERQDEIASKGYLRFSQALAGICFIGVCLLGMLFFYAKLALVIGGYFVLFALASILLCACSVAVRCSLSDGLGSLPKLMGSLGFLVTFSFIVLDYLFIEPIGVLAAVISLILSRQLFGKSANVLKDIAELHLQQGMLRALYFHAHAFHPERKKSGLIGIAGLDVRTNWMRESLATLMPIRPDSLSSSWISFETPELLCFVADVVTLEGMNRQILFKVFDPKRRSQAAHEASLLTQQKDLPSASFLGATIVEGMNCHLFDVTHLERVVLNDDRPGQDTVDELQSRVLATVPAPVLVSSYLRSRSRLSGRLDVASIEHLCRLYEGQQDLELLMRFKKCLPDIARIIGTSPLAIHLPDIRPNMLWRDRGGLPLLLHWGRWELEPLGFKWPGDATAIATFLGRLKQRRKDISELGFHQVRLATLCSRYEEVFRKGEYDKALGLVAIIISEYAECNRGEV